MVGHRIANMPEFSEWNSSDDEYWSKLTGTRQHYTHVRHPEADAECENNSTLHPNGTFHSKGAFQPKGTFEPISTFQPNRTFQPNGPFEPISTFRLNSTFSPKAAVDVSVPVAAKASSPRLPSKGSLGRVDAAAQGRLWRVEAWRRGAVAAEGTAEDCRSNERVGAIAAKECNGKARAEDTEHKSNGCGERVPLKAFRTQSETSSAAYFGPQVQASTAATSPFQTSQPGPPVHRTASTHALTPSAQQHHLGAPVGGAGSVASSRRMYGEQGEGAFNPGVKASPRRMYHVPPMDFSRPDEMQQLSGIFDEARNHRKVMKGAPLASVARVPSVDWGESEVMPLEAGAQRTCNGFLSVPPSPDPGWGFIEGRGAEEVPYSKSDGNAGGGGAEEPPHRRVGWFSRFKVWVARGKNLK